MSELKQEDSVNKRETQSAGFIPRFKWCFIHPRYWGIWLSVGLMIFICYWPARLRDPILAKLGNLLGRLAKSARRRARINLFYCFPGYSPQQREEIIDEMFAAILPTTILLVELAVRGSKPLGKRLVWHGKDYLDTAVTTEQNLILLVPHAWGVDCLGVLLAEQGHPISAMFHHQKNPVVDYLWNKARLIFGGQIHARQDGIKPFIQSVRQGYWGYYLPDQDHGEEQSEFVDFFATYKATLPAIGRLMKLCRAEVIPAFPVYDVKSSTLNIYVRPPMNDLLDADHHYIARRMNEEVEALVGPNLPHYTWILRLLKTRKEGEIEPYKRKDI